MPSPTAALRTVMMGPRRARKAVRNELHHLVRRLPVQPHVVLYEAYGGRGVLCNPEAIFRELLRSEDLQHLHHIWVLADTSAHADVVAEFHDDPRVSFIRYGSTRYTRALATAGYLVNNATFRPNFAKRDEQVYLNTWHGTPLKKMGHDEPGEARATRNVVRNFLMCDFVLSSCEYMTEQMYESAYRLLNIYTGKIIEEGSPRTDRQVVSPEVRREVRARLRAAGVSIGDDEHVVLYAPTWRGMSFSDPVDDALKFAQWAERMQQELPAGHRVLLKVHQQVFELASAHRELKPLLVPNDLPTNVVLGASDALVTDFSSIYFDALATGLPVVFFAPDLAEYSSLRGLYLDVAELPGPMATDAQEAGQLLALLGSGAELDPLVTHADAYRRARERYAPHDDGHVAARVVDIVFRSRSAGRRVHDVRKDGRQTILVYLGGMTSNGITTAALNLLRNIDSSRFDVTAAYRHQMTGERAVNAAAIPASTRRLARIGAFTHRKAHARKRRKMLDHGGAMSPDELQTMLTLLHGEWRRCVGSASFDYLVDFSGYSPFWSFMMAVAPTGSRSIWLHNDLRADQMREVDGIRPFENHLGAVFSSYRFYDHLVSVSPALREINARQLSEFAPDEKFTYARNPIDVERVRLGAKGDPALAADWPGDHLLEPLEPAEDGSVLTPDVIALQHGRPDLEPEIARRVALHQSPRTPGVTQFVAVGRISPEKNHARLIRAFAQVHRDHPDTRLVVIGDGPLREASEALTRDLRVADAVVFAGLQLNPWALMNECDVFVMSSDYEGQPMVILEALVLGLPVVTTAFGSVASALPEGSGLVVERSEEALAAGMRAALRGEVPHPHFDAEQYNREVMAEFYRAIGADQC